MITEAVQATELSHMQKHGWKNRKKNVKMCINDNRQKKCALNRQTEAD